MSYPGSQHHRSVFLSRSFLGPEQEYHNRTENVVAAFFSVVLYMGHFLLFLITLGELLLIFNLATQMLSGGTGAAATVGTKSQQP